MNKITVSEKIQKLVEGLNYFFIDIIIKGSENNLVFEIYIDNETGIASSDCSLVSKAVQEFLENMEDPVLNYKIDVSSPGVSRPLKYLGQFEKHLNRYFEVKYMVGEENKKETMKLIAVNNEILIFNNGKDETPISFNNIKSAKVKISFG